MADRAHVKDLFALMPSRFNPSAAKGIKAVYQFTFSGSDGGNYNLVIDDGRLGVLEGTHPVPDLTITMSGTDYVDMANGILNPQMAYMSGQMKLTGDLELASKLEQLFPMNARTESPDSSPTMDGPEYKREEPAIKTAVVSPAPPSPQPSSGKLSGHS